MAEIQFDEPHGYHGLFPLRNQASPTNIRGMEFATGDGNDETERNIELKRHIKKLEYELYLWKRCANECSEKLKKLNSTKINKPGLNVFPDSSMRLLETLANENVELSNDVSTLGGNSQAIGNQKSISVLQEKLEIKFRDNQRLKQFINGLQNPEKCKLYLEKLQDKYLQVQQENRNLKLNLLTRDSIPANLNTKFNELVNEFINILSISYSKHGIAFTNQLESLKDVLLKSDATTNTTPDFKILHVNDQDNSAYLSEAFQELTMQNNELQKAKEKICKLEDVRNKKHVNIALENLNKSLSDKERGIESMENQLKKLESQQRDVRKKLAQSEYELKSRKQELQGIADMTSKKKKERDELEINYKRLEKKYNELSFSRQAYETPGRMRYNSSPMAEQYTFPIPDARRSTVPEPHETVNWGRSYHPSILVRDSPTTTKRGLNPSPLSSPSDASSYLHSSLKAPFKDCIREKEMDTTSYFHATVGEEKLIICEQCGKQYGFEVFVEHEKFCHK